MKDTLIHHHIGGGGQGMSIPQRLHPDNSGINNIEKAYRICGNDGDYATMLQKLLSNP